LLPTTEGHTRLRELKREINTKTSNTAHTLVHNYTDRMRVINTHTFHFNTTIKRESVLLMGRSSRR